jgi:hypothetical protein
MECKATINAQEVDIPKINNGFYYMASPYSNIAPHIEFWRYDQNLEVLAKLTYLGYIVLSPIVHSHPMAHAFVMPKGFEFWKQIDTTFMDHATGLIVLMLDGWKESKGVRSEIKYMEAIGKPVYYLDYYHSELQYLEIDLKDKCEAEKANVFTSNFFHGGSE